MPRRPKTVVGLLVALARIYLGRFDSRRFARVFFGGLLLLVVWVIWSAAGSRCRGPAHARHPADRAEATDGPPINLAVAPAIVWTGSQYGVAWIDLRDRRTEVYFARVDPAGHRIGGPSRVTDRASVKALPHVAWDGREFMITWTDVSGSDSEIMLARLDATGQRSGEVTSVSSEPGRDFGARAAWNGSHLGIAWLHVESRTAYGLRFARVDAEGRRVGGAIDLRAHALLTGSPDVVAEGTGFAVAFNEFGLRARATTTSVVRLDAEGTPRAPQVASTRAGLAAQVAMDSHDGVAGVAWRDDIAMDHSTVSFAVVGPEGPAASRIPLTDGRRYAGNPSTAAARSGYGVALEMNAGAQTSVYFVAVSDHGTPRGGASRVPTHAALAQSPDIVWNGETYALVWSDHRARGPAIYFTRLSAEGTRLGEDSPVSGP